MVRRPYLTLSMFVFLLSQPLFAKISADECTRIADQAIEKCNTAGADAVRRAAVFADWNAAGTVDPTTRKGAEAGMGAAERGRKEYEGGRDACKRIKSDKKAGCAACKPENVTEGSLGDRLKSGQALRTCERQVDDKTSELEKGVASQEEARKGFEKARDAAMAKPENKPPGKPGGEPPGGPGKPSSPGGSPGGSESGSGSGQQGQGQGGGAGGMPPIPPMPQDQKKEDKKPAGLDCRVTPGLPQCMPANATPVQPTIDCSNPNFAQNPACKNRPLVGTAPANGGIGIASVDGNNSALSMKIAAVCTPGSALANSEECARLKVEQFCSVKERIGVCPSCRTDLAAGVESASRLDLEKMCTTMCIQDPVHGPALAGRCRSVFGAQK